MAEPLGFFTDTTVCIGCKACEVACKEWNQLPAANGGLRELSGNSSDNTQRLDGIHWRHVNFIQFGPIKALHQRAERRVQQLHELGERRAYLYGADERMLGGLNSFYLLVDKPEVYGLPPDPQMPTRNLKSGSWFSVLGAVLVGLMGVINFRNRGARLQAE